MKLIKELFVLVFVSSSALSSMEVTVFDVGQGNCTLVSFDGMESKEAPLLIDCGSTSYKYRGRLYKGELITQIVNKIIKSVAKTKLKEFNIVISHPDEDHYNWVAKVIADCKGKGVGVGNVTLGGLINHYKGLKTEDKKNTLKQFLEKADSQSVQFHTKNGSKDESLPISVSKALMYQVLPALKLEEKVSSNDSSLVVLVTYGNLSCIVMGDATRKTIEHINKNEKKYKLKPCDLFIASHHGAESDGCNDKTLIEMLKPKVIVVSSGICSHRHPKASKIKLFEDSLSDEDPSSYHPVVFEIGDVQSFGLKCRALMGKGGDIASRKGYGLGVTRKALYGTLGQGTMVFTWKVDDAEVSRPKCAIPCSYENEKSCVLNSLVCSVGSALSLRGCKMIDLSNLDINDDWLEDRNLLRGILLSLLEECLIEGSGFALKELHLSFNVIQTRQSVYFIEKLLLHSGIRDFQMKGAGLPDWLKKKMGEIWGNRGLVL